MKIPCGEYENNFEVPVASFTFIWIHEQVYTSIPEEEPVAPSTGLTFLSGCVYGLGEHYDTHTASPAGPLEGRR